MFFRSAVAEFLDGPNGVSNKKLLKNIAVFGLVCAVLYNWDVVIGEIEDVPAPAPAK